MQAVQQLRVAAVAAHCVALAWTTATQGPTAAKKDPVATHLLLGWNMVDLNLTVGALLG